MIPRRRRYYVAWTTRKPCSRATRCYRRAGARRPGHRGTRCTPSPGYAGTRGRRTARSGRLPGSRKPRSAALREKYSHESLSSRSPYSAISPVGSEGRGAVRQHPSRRSPWCGSRQRHDLATAKKPQSWRARAAPGSSEWPGAPRGASWQCPHPPGLRPLPPNSAVAPSRAASIAGNGPTRRDLREEVGAERSALRTGIPVLMTSRCGPSPDRTARPPASLQPCHSNTASSDAFACQSPRSRPRHRARSTNGWPRSPPAQPGRSDDEAE